jgi:hypothetical protein
MARSKTRRLGNLNDQDIGTAPETVTIPSVRRRGACVARKQSIPRKRAPKVPGATSSLDNSRAPQAAHPPGSTYYLLLTTARAPSLPVYDESWFRPYCSNSFLGSTDDQDRPRMFPGGVSLKAPFGRVLVPPGPPPPALLAETDAQPKESLVVHSRKKRVLLGLPTIQVDVRHHFRRAAR